MKGNNDLRWYAQVEIAGVDSSWKSPRKDGTGDSLMERYSRVVGEFRLQGRDVLVPSAAETRTVDGLPKEIYVEVDIVSDGLLKNILGDIPAREGIVCKQRAVIVRDYIQGRYGSSIERVV